MSLVEIVNAIKPAFWDKKCHFRQILLFQANRAEKSHGNAAFPGDLSGIAKLSVAKHNRPCSVSEHGLFWESNVISWVCAGGRCNGTPASLWHTPVDEQDILLLTYKEAALTGGFWYTIRGSILACGLGRGRLWKPTGLPFTPCPSSP